MKFFFMQKTTEEEKNRVFSSSVKFSVCFKQLGSELFY